jgi:hypothetical protein
MNLRDFGQRLIPTGERSGLQTRIAVLIEPRLLELTGFTGS